MWAENKFNEEVSFFTTTEKANPEEANPEEANPEEANPEEATTPLNPAAEEPAAEAQPQAQAQAQAGGSSSQSSSSLLNELNYELHLSMYVQKLLKMLIYRYLNHAGIELTYKEYMMEMFVNMVVFSVLNISNGEYFVCYLVDQRLRDRPARDESGLSADRLSRGL